jgi:hypothetical protein
MRFVFCLAILLAASYSIAAPELRVKFDEAQLSLSTKKDSSWNFMDVRFDLVGEGFDQVKWVYKPEFSRMATDLGDVASRNSYDDNSYPRLWRVDYLSDNDKQNQKYRLWERIGLPKTGSRLLFVEGVAEVYVGGANDYVEVKHYLQNSGKSIKAPLLDKYDIEVSFMTKDDLIDMQEKMNAEKEKARKDKREIENMGKELGNAFSELLVEAFKNAFSFGGQADLTFVMKDMSGRLLNVELYDDNGNLMEVQSRSFHHDKDAGTFRIGMSYKRMLPHEGTVRIYVDRGDGVVTVPFNNTVQLPW